LVQKIQHKYNLELLSIHIPDKKTYILLIRAKGRKNKVKITKGKNTRRKYYIVNLFCIFFLVLILLATYFIPKNNECVSIEKIATDDNKTRSFESSELKGVWIPFYTLDMKGTNYTEKEFKEKFETIASNCKNFGFTDIFVHVRSHGDAYYKSNYFPPSHFITGKQGSPLNFDPLKIMVEIAHRYNLKFHAWINPYRIQLNNCPNYLSENNYFNIWKNSDKEIERDYVVDFGKEKYFNPGYSEVRSLIVKGIEEIVRNYDVDGIHFDDYFYPENKPDFDQKCYEDYLKSLNGNLQMPKEEWRATNVNSLIANVYSAIKNIKPSVLLGISVCGNIMVNDRISADVRTWSQTPGYVDYICPEIYWNFEHPILPFDKGVNEWKNVVDRNFVKLYHGLGVYKAGSERDNGTWKKSDNILQSEVELARKSGSDGFILYAYEQLFDPKTQNEVTNVMKALNN